MKRNIWVFFTLAALISCSVISNAAEYSAWTKGETWQYKHEGPIPFLGDQSTVVGDRVIRIIEVKEADGEKRWKLRENWGENNEFRTFTIDAEHQAHLLDWGGDMIRYEPPLPMDFSSLALGAEQTDDVLMKFGKVGFKCNILAKRLPDQDVAVPAGDFKQCAHVKIKMTMHYGSLQQPIDYEVWYHPRANFIVKEQYHFKAMKLGGLEWGSHQCVSELKEHSKPAKD